MSKLQDDLAELKQNKTGIRFATLIRLLKSHGWEHRSTAGSHCVFVKKSRLPILLVKPHGKHKFCHPMDVNKVIAALTDISAEEEDEEDE